ncbi:MAG: alpha-glucuronidase family glycosyl hydrolase [Acidobacteriota bacterium]
MTYCRILPASLLLLLLGTVTAARADDGYELWLKYRPVADPALLNSYREAFRHVAVPGTSETVRVIRDELERALAGLLGEPPVFRNAVQGPGGLLIGTPWNSAQVASLDWEDELRELGPEGYLLRQAELDGAAAWVLASESEVGLLYGTFRLLRELQMGTPLPHLGCHDRPRVRWRMLNHWDNLDGSIERGYAGKSLWKWEELPDRIDARYTDYARANASLGINAVVLNNVNADPRLLLPEYLEKVAALARVFRPYGIRVFLAVNFASPTKGRFTLEQRRGGIGDLETADPLDPRVREWWRRKADEIYQHIPDFGGFLVKASSEGMPGPQDYGRTHADGANMLAEALAPHGGVVLWRAFVYRPETDPDRANRAYKEFVPEDGRFLPNVLIQAKNGAVDFQPREPVQPLFGAMTQTPLALELQITQEYLGQSKHLVYLGTQWREYLDFDLFSEGRDTRLAKIIDGSLTGHRLTAVAGVANTGSDRNWCGHFFSQANWFAFGRLAWDPDADPARIAEDWIRMSLSQDEEVVTTVRDMMMGSWEAAVDYMTPLGLHHLFDLPTHYRPDPARATGRVDWSAVYYHRAGPDGIGFDRTTRGSNGVSQYAPPLAKLFNDPETCPEKYLLWFHHLPWDFRMKSGRTLWEELCLHYNRGIRYVEQMIATWENLEGKVDAEIHRHVAERLATQLTDAREWRDVCLEYFQQFSGRPIVEE